MNRHVPSNTRVRFAGILVLLLASGATIWAGLRTRPQAETPSPTTPETALDELKAGNQRFVKSQRTRSTDTRADADRRKELTKGQHPIAAILTCADSRVVPEFIFDQGPGRIFDTRNAGNVVGEDVLGSLEYAVEHLHVPVVVVMGHKGCGAVAAVADAGKEPLPGHLKDIQDRMKAVQGEALKAGADRPADFLVRLCALNAQAQARRVLGESKPLREAVKKKETVIAVALYDMETGAVEWKDFDPDAEK
jgi:carbonic anhydrase